MTLQTHDDAISTIATDLADNTSGDVTPSDVRTVATNLLDGIWRLNSTAITNTASPYSVDLEVTQVLLADPTSGAITVNLPAADSSTNKVLYVKRTGTTNNVVLDGNASETIDGATTYTLSAQYDCVRVFCDGSNWHVLSTE